MRTNILLGALACLIGASGSAQMPPGLEGRDSYAIRTINMSEPCRFDAEYRRIEANKSDPRVAYIEGEPVVGRDDEAQGIDVRCRAISEQFEDNITFFDQKNGYLHLVFGAPVIADTLAYFAGNTPEDSVMLYTARWDDEWQTYAMQFRDGRWQSVGDRYLRPLHIESSDLVILPQFGRTFRVLHWDGERFIHKNWLTWTGTEFSLITAETAKKSWRCPESIRYFEPEERAQYCE